MDSSSSSSSYMEWVVPIGNMLAKLPKNPTTGWRIDDKVGFLLFLTHLDVCLRRGHGNRHLRIQEYNCKLTARLNANYQTLRVERRPVANPICVPELGLKWRLYRQFTNFFHLCNGLKYALIMIMMSETLLSVESSCYLVGRMFSQYEVSDYMYVLAFALSLLVLAWRYTFLVSKRSFEMDILVFLMHDESTIELEVARIVQLDHLPVKSIGMRRESQSQSILRDALCYPLMDGSRRIGFRLRPNRTEECRKNLHIVLDGIVLLSLMMILGFAIVVSPTVLEGLLKDASYIRTYPRCCPDLERMALNKTLELTQISFNLCRTKRISFIFDLIVNVIIHFDSYMIVIMPTIISALITYDLSVYWAAIDQKTKCLAEQMRYKNIFHSNQAQLFEYNRYPLGGSGLVMDDWRFRPAHHHGSPGIKRLHNQATDNYIVELQSLLCDFFECVRRANKFVSILLTFFIGLYLMGMFLFGFYVWKIEYLYNLFLARYLFALANINVIVCSSIILRLKHMIDRSYVDLCSIMAQDRSYMKIRWMKILEFYTPEKRSSFTVMKNSRFTWMFVLNMVATMISFLLAVETYRS